ncbi:hypothetical protein AXF19_04660 [Selenomonas sp. oral taxon 126]|uniref:hypothetical protein n=1 Tax=Selenomonas sp. oral taxon 126 TaxID=712528 RepID=UPI000807944C|nr:hypothetical protein [Selenomonas sp. oral taxon 126]ANR70337.1 hypothetical protein AXF19_04660 [Selenomonas sp. oral taxon 126]
MCMNKNVHPLYDNIDAAIQDLFDDVDAELSIRSFDENSLFDHFMVTLHKLFSIVRFQYGKAARDLSKEDIAEFVTPYWTKFNALLPSHRIKELTKYDYDTYYEEYVGVLFPKNRGISIYDYILLATGKASRDEVEEWERKRFIAAYRDHLPNFFGIKYSKEQPDEWRYEVIRLVKILYDCSDKVISGSFLCIQHPSLVKFNPLLHTNYTDAVKFIKSRVILRECYSNDMAGLQRIAHMEKYADALQSFLQSISYQSIDYIIQHLEGNIPCKMKRSICHEVYETITCNLENTPLKYHVAYDHLDDPNAVPYHAYIHFILSGINGYLTLMQSSNGYYPTVDSSFYDKAALLPCEFIENEAGLPSYVHNNRSTIIELIYKEACTKGERKKYATYLSRHMENYQFLYAFSKELNANEAGSLSSMDILYIIKFYETISQDGPDISLNSGYTKKKSKPLKINALLQKMCEKHFKKNDAILSDEEYMIANLWLQDRIAAFWDMRTAAIQAEMCKIQHEILYIWENCIPRLTYLDDPPPSLNEFVAQILPEKDLQELVNQYSKPM